MAKVVAITLRPMPRTPPVGKDKCDMKDGKSCCAGKDTKAAMKECKKNGCCKDGKSCGEANEDKTAMGAAAISANSIRKRRQGVSSN